MGFYSDQDLTPERSIGYQLRALNQVLAGKLERPLAHHGLTYTQWQVLVSIYLHRGLTCAALARDLAHDKGAMTRVVDALEARGWVTRERDAGDRRVLNLALTDAGRSIADEGKAQVLECWNAWLDGWDRADVETLIASLQRLRATVERTEVDA